MPLPTEPRLFPTLLLPALLAGCAQWPGAEPGTATAPASPPAPMASPAAVVPPAAAAPTAAESPPSPAEAARAAAARLLAWQERLRELPAADLAREIAMREPPADTAASVEQALALLQLRALALAAGTPANGELARALALVEPVSRQPSPWQAAARLLVARLAEQRKLEEQLAQAQQQLREQQRRNEQLAAQIEALRAIERSLGGTRAPAPAAPR